MSAQIHELISRYQPRLHGFIRQQVRDDSAADDLTQETWIRIARHLQQLQDGQKLESWIYRIARNIVADYFRSRRETLELTNGSSSAPKVHEIEELRQQLFDYVRRVVVNLPEHHRDVLTLTLDDGLSHQQLAERLGISLTAAKSRVQRARNEVRKVMEGCCHWKFDRRGNIVDCIPRHK